MLQRLVDLDFDCAALGKLAKFVWSVFKTDESADRESDKLQQLAQLPVLSLVCADREPVIGLLSGVHILKNNVNWTILDTLHGQPTSERLDLLCCDSSKHSHAVDARDVGRRTHQKLCQVSVIREQQQAF